MGDKVNTERIMAQPYASNSAIDLIINFKVKDEARTTVNEKVRNLAMLIDSKIPIPEDKGFVMISTVDALKLYTDNKNALSIVNGELNKIYLVDKKAKDLQKCLDMVSRIAFTLLMEDEKTSIIDKIQLTSSLDLDYEEVIKDKDGEKIILNKEFRQKRSLKRVITKNDSDVTIEFQEGSFIINKQPEPIKIISNIDLTTATVTIDLSTPSVVEIDDKITKGTEENEYLIEVKKLLEVGSFIITLTANDSNYVSPVYKIMEEEPSKDDIYTFNGVIVRWAQKSFLDNNPEWVNPQYEITVIKNKEDVDIEAWLLNNFLTNRDWDNLQYKSHPIYKSPFSTNKEVIEAKKRHVTFMYFDKVTIKESRLFYFRTGTEAVSIPYIITEVKSQIQVDMMNLIASKKMEYINANISLLKVVGNDVLRRYIERGVIGPLSNIEMPTMRDQELNDIINGKINGIKLYIQKMSAIWNLEGEIENGYE